MNLQEHHNFDRLCALVVLSHMVEGAPLRRLLPQVKAIAEALDDNTDLLVSSLGGLKFTQGKATTAIFDLSFNKMREQHSVVRHADSKIRHALLSAVAAVSRVLSGRRLSHGSAGMAEKRKGGEGTIQAVQRRHFAESGRLVSTEPSLRRIFKVLLLLRSTFACEEVSARRNGTDYGLSSLPTHVSMAFLPSAAGVDRAESGTPFCVTAVALMDLARAHDITLEGEDAVREMAKRHSRDMLPPLFASVAATVASGSWSEYHCHQVLLEQLLSILVCPLRIGVGVCSLPLILHTPAANFALISNVRTAHKDRTLGCFTCKGWSRRRPGFDEGKEKFAGNCWHSWGWSTMPEDKCTVLCGLICSRVYCWV